MSDHCPFDDDPNAGELLSPEAQQRAIEASSHPFSSFDRSISRRDFLKSTAAAWFSLLLPVRLFRRVADAAVMPGLPTGAPNRTLVLLELNGGNDGLNTVIPYTDGLYFQARHRIAIPRDQVLQLSGEFGFHPSMAPIMPLWQNQELAIVHGVGYPEPNRSHFRSIAIWETGSDSDQYLDDGWLARLFQRSPVLPGAIADGIVIGNGPAGPLSSATSRVLSMERPEEFLRQSATLPEPPVGGTGNPALDHILDVEREIRQAAGVLGERMRQAPAFRTVFPKSRISNHLQVAAKLIASGTPVPVIKLSHGSFDTHSGQIDRQARLLQELSEGLQAFRGALQEVDRWNHTLMLTYSEFGRRVTDNDSGGTDHGSAAPHFLIGGQVKGGFFGRHPSLDHLVDGDLEHHVDYRSLYDTVARGWWNVRGDFLNGHNYPAIKCFK